jgi:Sec-independent protein translocase protein TatA
MFFRIGWTECLIILVVLAIVVGMAYRGGYFRARRK